MSVAREATDFKVQLIDSQDILYVTDEKGHLGSGSFGAVAVRVGFFENRLVAAKCFYFGGGFRQNKDLEREVRKELDHLQRTNQENIVKVIGWATWHHSAAIIMEYMPGGDLWSLVQNKDIPLDLTLALQFCAEVATGLAYIHHERLVHSDIKPENILLTENLKCKIADFGSAHLSIYTRHSASSHKTEPHIRFTELFAAPELLECPSRSPHFPQDTYSFAILAYTIIIRKRPVETPYLKDRYLQQIQNRERPFLKRLRERREKLPSSDESDELKILTQLTTTIKDCSKFEPTDRPHMKNIKEDLCTFLQNFDVSEAVELAKQKHNFIHFEFKSSELKPLKEYRIEEDVVQPSYHAQPSVSQVASMASASTRERNVHEARDDAFFPSVSGARTNMNTAASNHSQTGNLPFLQYAVENQNFQSGVAPSQLHYSTQVPFYPQYPNASFQNMQQPPNASFPMQANAFPLGFNPAGAAPTFSMQPPGNVPGYPQHSAGNIRSTGNVSTQQRQSVPIPYFTLGLNIQIIPGPGWMTMPPTPQQPLIATSNPQMYGSTQPARLATNSAPSTTTRSNSMQTHASRLSTENDHLLQVPAFGTQPAVATSDKSESTSTSLSSDSIVDYSGSTGAGN